jgi:hypothetical protein
MVNPAKHLPFAEDILGRTDLLLPSHFTDGVVLASIKLFRTGSTLGAVSAPDDFDVHGLRTFGALYLVASCFFPFVRRRDARVEPGILIV